jgi:hypothetical protein
MNLLVLMRSGGRVPQVPRSASELTWDCWCENAVHGRACFSTRVSVPKQKRRGRLTRRMMGREPGAPGRQLVDVGVHLCVFGSAPTKVAVLVFRVTVQ